MANKKKYTEFKNVTENELMVFDIYSDEDYKHVVEIKPNDTVYFSEKDIKAHANDIRFLQGRIVLVGSDKELYTTNELSDIMSDLQIEYFIKNISDIEVLATKLGAVKSINTVTRLLKVAKLPANEKTYNFVSVIEKHLTELVKSKEALIGKTEKETSITSPKVVKERN